MPNPGHRSGKQLCFPRQQFLCLDSSTHREASKGRLNGDGAWSPSGNNDANDYLQIDLKDQFFVCAVATQGSSSDDHWTTKYKLLYSLDNSTWLTYQENDIDKVCLDKRHWQRN